jgi:hypothetical protein
MTTLLLGASAGPDSSPPSHKMRTRLAILNDELRYERFAPRPALQQVVEHFWLVTAPPISGLRSEILIPNGRPMVLICLGDPACVWLPTELAKRTHVDWSAF